MRVVKAERLSLLRLAALVERGVLSAQKLLHPLDHPRAARLGKSFEADQYLSDLTDQFGRHSHSVAADRRLSRRPCVPLLFTYFAGMGTPLFTLLCLSGEPGIVECSYCALTRVLDADEVSAAFGEAATIEDIEGLPCPRCSIKNDARTRWTRAKVATPDDLLRAAHPGRGGGRGHGRAPKKRSSSRWAD